MAKSSGTSIQKREKERARQQKQLDKNQRKAETKERKGKGRDSVDGEDPDIAGIVPGPQALPPGFDGPDATQPVPVPARR